MQDIQLPQGLNPNVLQHIQTLMQQRQFAAAQPLTEQLKQEFPTFFVGWYWHALCALGQNNLWEARQSLQKTLDINPDLPDAHLKLGLVLMNEKEFTAAIPHLQTAATALPNDVNTQLQLAQCYVAMGKPIAAIPHYQAVLNGLPQQNPLYGQTSLNITKLLCKVSDYAPAKDYIDQLIAKNPENAELQYLKGHIYNALEQPEGAHQAFQTALELNPTNLNPAYSWVFSLGENNQIDAVIQKMIQLLAQHPQDVKLFYYLCLVAPQEMTDDILSPITQALPNLENDPEKASYIHFGLANLAEYNKDYHTAFSHYLQANQAFSKISVYSAPATQILVEKLTNISPQTWQQNKLTQTEDSNITPIFIVGMPRSGTSLAEQILAAHPSVYGAGELLHLEILIHHVFESPDDKQLNLNTLTAQNLRFIQTEYLRRAQQCLPISHKHTAIVDKMPLNFRWIGLIQTIFPNAKIIHTTRDPRATCTSNFTQRFKAGGVNFSNSFNGLINFYGHYQTLMDHWSKTFPNQIYELNYENLIENQEDESRKLIDFCGLDWDDKCLEFYKANRPVKTASLQQVRQKIYKTSLKSWEKYGDEINPLIEGLKPYIK